MTKTALLIIDVQYDFIDGSLAVPKAAEIIPGILKLMDENQYKFDSIILSQDWHPKNHASFASSHGEDVKPFDQVEFKHPRDESIKAMQTVWPDHCRQFTHGSCFPPEICTAFRNIDAHKTTKTIIQKGELQDRDYYSAFNDVWNDKKTELDDYLKKNGIDHVITCGLAYDYCVKFTSESSAKLGYKTSVIKPLSRAIAYDKLDEIDDYYKSFGIEIIEDLSQLDQFKV